MKNKTKNVMDIKVDIKIPREPKELKEYSYEDLEKLATKIRQKIIETVSKTGGHLSSNLGAVELTLAIHRVFETPKDLVVWDVGHQSYAHKLITGRWEKFETLRQYRGICGYPLPEESEHDFFAVGHSSTSLSAALGMALARKIKNEKGHVVAVIGDGAITAGMAFEALNSIGFMRVPVIVILNENGVSISPNVGALGKYTNKLTNKIVNSPVFEEVRKDIHLLLDNIKDEKLKEAVKRLRIKALSVLSDEIVFEQLGFSYIGPIDGHNIKEMEEAFTRAKEANGPVLVHVKTIKGFGYPPAEKNPTKYHSSAKFDIKTGEFIKKSGPIKWTKAFSSALVKLASKDKRIVGITAAMPDGTGIIEMIKRFPDRAFDVGIAEQNAVTMAAGMATQGMIPVVAIYSTFMQRAYDQFVHDICLQNLHVVLCLDRAGIVGNDGPTHHGAFDLSYSRIPPNAIVMAPKDEQELQNMLFSAIEKMNGPVVIRYPRGQAIGVELKEEFEEVPVGKGEVVFETDNPEVLIIAIGSMVYPSINAAKELNNEGIQAKVINARFVKPLDKTLILENANKIKKILIVEENALMGGFGSAVLELLADNKISSEVLRLGIPDKWITWGNADELRKNIGLCKDGIKRKIKEMLR